jgi:hypothetical protein
VLATSSTSLALRPFHRFIAAGAAALVLLLTILAVSPQLHAGLHAHDVATDSAQNDDGCVISLFAGGVTAAPVAVTLTAPTVVHTEIAFAPRAEIFVSPPRYLHQPERGPPQN